MKILLFTTIILLISCSNNDDKIIALLNSKESYDVILGAYKAGESGNKKFVSLLLSNAEDERMCTNIRFKGITVYQAKMIALKKIYNKEPPVKITYIFDSIVVSFYKKLSMTIE